MTQVSAVVCTHLAERVDQLRAAVDSLRRQTLPLAELVVVVDGDEALGELVRGALPDEQVLVRGRCEGLARARNDGTAQTTAPVVVFLDDDAVAEPTWVERLMTTLEDERTLGVSGVSLPLWEGKEPAWLPGEYWWALGLTYTGQLEAAGRERVVRNVYGGCAAFRRDVLRDVGGFDPAYGHRPGSSAGGEEADLCLRALQVRPDGLFRLDPEAVIRHRVSRSRASVRYLWRRCFDEGHAKARVGARHERGSLSSERHFARRLPRALWGELRAGRLAAAAGLVLLSAAVLAGFVRGALTSGRRPA